MNVARAVLRLALGERLPTHAGQITLDGLEAPIAIHRDRYGVPHIEARTDADAWYALGFCQGQDRTFQLEMLLRMARGTLSAMVGEQAVKLDRLSRRIGFRRSAEEQFPVLHSDVREMLGAFARGVTAGGTQGLEKVPHEFALLQCEPTPYRAEDVLGMMKYLSLVLSPWPTKLARLLVLTHDGPDAVEAITNTYPAWHAVTRPVGARAGKVAARLGDDLAHLVGVVGTWAASNNWALASSRTATGRPILANDPHLAPMAPVPWYLSHIRTPEWEVAGASFIGSPGIAIGHNEVAAWGVTAGLVDDIDLYLEEIGPDGRSVREGNGFVPCQVRQEFIQVKGQPPVEEKVIVTSRGPVVGPALDEEFDAVSMSATWLASHPIEGYLRLQRVQSFDEFREVFSDWSLGSYNLVYADKSDDIGWQLVGEAPERREMWGTVPLPGWDPAVTWGEEVIPYDRMPHLSNPEGGFIATANNKPTPDEDGPYLGDMWAEGYRVMRIDDMLRERNDWGVDDMLRLQMDQMSVPWWEMRDVVLSAPVQTEDERLARDLLAAWDGVVSADSPAAAVYEFFTAELFERVVEAKAPNSTRIAMGRSFNPLIRGAWFDHRSVSRLVQLLEAQPAGYFERSWPEEVADVLGAVVARLRADYGPTPVDWRWGDLRQVTFSHLLGEQPPFDALFNLGPFPFGGDGETVAQARPWLAHLTRNPLAVPSMRMALDVGNWDVNRFVLPGGQSGNPFSRHYDDQLTLFLEGTAMVMPWAEEQVIAATQATLTLVPARSADELEMPVARPRLAT